MGSSCSSHIITRCERRSNSPAATGVATVVKLDGKAQEFWQPVRAGDILSDNPNCILCSSEALNVDSPVVHLAGDEELHPGQLYFLLPTAKSQLPLSLHDLCVLAVKASTALGDSRLNAVRGPPGGEVFSAGALVAADASLGSAFKLFMVSKR